MISIKATKKDFWDSGTEGFIFLMNENLNTAADLNHLEKIGREHYPHVKSVLSKHKFEGKVGQIFTLSAFSKNQLIQFVFSGIGKQNSQWNVNLETLRRAVAQAILTIKKMSIESAILALPDPKPYKISQEELLEQIVTTCHMADYEFSTFKTKKAKKTDIKLLIKVPSSGKFDSAVKNGNIIGQACNIGRNWSDLPANMLTPTIFSKQIEDLAAKSSNLKYTVFGDSKAKKLGMGGFLAVGSGSEQESKFVILEYKIKLKKAKTIAIVGKGVMFDSGGISLKPASSMAGMKFDMSGAASVMATMLAIDQIKPDVNVVGLAPLVENMPSGKALRQDDIITMMNGKTVEIANTDAEGRLILADALCYAEKYYNPDVIIDIATLTGACLHALGKFYSGLMTKDEKLQSELIKIGNRTGDRVWPLPLDDDYKKANKSEVADVRNCGSSFYKAGTITAACFLQEFVQQKTWVHLDIAGTDNDVPINYNGKGSAGAGIRLLIKFIETYK
jgi:leucyl aminopeptidase